MQKHVKQLKNEKGMTLIELLAVLVILGIIAAIAIPMIGNVINDSRDKAILADAQTILSGAQIAYSNGDGTKSTKDNKTVITFDSSILAPYVEGVTLDANDKVVYNVDDKEWTITYKKLGEMKKQKKYGLTDDDTKKVTTVKSTVLNKALEGKNND